MSRFQNSHHGARGCRGSRRDVFSNIFRDVVVEGATAFEQAAKENDNDDMATLARAFAESFKSSSSQPQQAKSDTSAGTPVAPAAASAAVAPAKPQEPGVAVVRPTSSSTSRETEKRVAEEDEEGWEVPDVEKSPSAAEGVNVDELDPFEKWKPALQQLALLGFTESENYIEFLEEEKGDLERVVNCIVRRAA